MEQKTLLKNKKNQGNGGETMAKRDDSVKKKVPELRFKGFTDDWEERKLSDIADRFNNLRVPITASERKSGDTPYYGANGIQDYVEGFTHDGEFILVAEDGANDLKNYPVQYVNGKVWVNNHAHVLQGKNTITDNKFLMNSIKNLNIEPFLVGGGRAKLNADIMMKLNILLPTFDEQQKIGSFFEQLDNTIALHQRKLDLLKEQKKGFLQKMFPKNGEKVPELRFKGFTDDWEERKFKDILKTHSFRSYLAGVSENGEYEVIQQGDKPIVGYSDGEPFTDYKDVTLFGDHTVSLYKPKSPFFVATDGVKILSADNFEGNYLYTTLERYKPEPQGYKRHFTILKNQDVWFTENIEEQQKIGSFFKQLDETIDLHQRKLDLLKEQKKGFLQKMFV